MTEFLTYSGLNAVQLNEKLLIILRNVRQMLIETTLIPYPDDNGEVVVIKEELISILKGFAVFFKEFEFNVYNAPDLINLLIVNAKRIEFTDDEVANKDRVFGVLLAFAHFQDGMMRLKKATEYRVVLPTEDVSWFNSVYLVAGVAVVCFFAGGYAQALRPSLFQALVRRK